MDKIVIINGHPKDISTLRAFYTSLFPGCELEFLSRKPENKEKDVLFENPVEDDIEVWEI